jgi:hypothetical protein
LTSIRTARTLSRHPSPSHIQQQWRCLPVFTWREIIKSLPDNNRLVLEFVEYLKGAGLTVATIEQYTAALRRYEAYLQPDGLLSSSLERLSAFLETLYVDGLSLRRRHFLAALRRLYRFGISMGYTKVDLTVDYPRSRKTLHLVPVPRARTILLQCRPDAPIIDGFQCSECEWSYVMPDSKPYLIAPEEAQRACGDFDGHRCGDFKPRNKEAAA